jgi:type I restriction enzyme S subunit
MEKKLPIGWIETKLELATEILDNLRKPINSTERGGRIGNIPYYGATGQTGWIDDYLFDEELVLVGEDGAPFFEKTKNVAYLINGKSWVNNHAHVLKAISKISSNKFLLHFLNQFDYKDFVGGTTRLKLTQGDLKIILIPLPPLPEQQRIVAKLDTLLGHLDTLKTRLDRIPQLLKDFRQKVLTQAVTGKLTEEWREGENLKGIELKTGKYEIEFEFLETYDFPETWNYIALGNYAECSRGKFTARPRNDPQFFDGEYPFMQIGDLPANGGLFYSYSSTLNEKGKSVSKCFPKGTVVIAIVGATIGNTGILEKEVFFPDSLIGINSENFFSNFYIEYFLRCIKYKIRELSYAGGGQPNIKLPNITNLGIAIPPIEEQQEIVRRVESLFAKADQIEASYQKLKIKIEQLPQALLAKAFRGELVEQLPTDGDARELLKQIKLAKAGLGKGGRTKKMKVEDELRMVAEDGVRYGKR